MRRQKSILVCVTLALFVLGSGADQSARLPEGIEIKTHAGWARSLFLNAPDPEIQAVVVPAVGGRILQYSLRGENILFENPGSEGKTLANTKEGFWVGGYQCDLGPELRGLPDHQTLWVGPH